MHPSVSPAGPVCAVIIPIARQQALPGLVVEPEAAEVEEPDGALLRGAAELLEQSPERIESHVRDLLLARVCGRTLRRSGGRSG